MRLRGPLMTIYPKTARFKTLPCATASWHVTMSVSMAGGSRSANTSAGLRALSSRAPAPAARCGEFTALWTWSMSGRTALESTDT
jgi:hypothetical protein